MKKEELTQKYLKKILHYNSETGIFTWLERPLSMFNPGKWQLRSCGMWNTRFSDTEAGTKWTSKRSKTFYIHINIALNGKTRQYKAHRLVFLYTEGQFPPEQVDHINGNGCDNREINLKKVGHKENHKNKPIYSNNTSGCVGVTWFKRDQKWRAYIMVDGKSRHGGYFTSIEGAIAKRKQMEIEYSFHKNHGRKIKP